MEQIPGQAVNLGELDRAVGGLEPLAGPVPPVWSETFTPAATGVNVSDHTQSETDRVA